jgi:hypothetical protein
MCTAWRRGPLLASLAGLFLAVVIAAAGTGCDPGHTLTYRNDTGKTVTVSSASTEIVTLRPQEEKKFSTLEFVGEEIFEVRDENGRVIYSETLTWDDLKRMGWKIVITEPTPTGGSPTPGANDPGSHLQ